MEVMAKLWAQVTETDTSVEEISENVKSSIIDESIHTEPQKTKEPSDEDHYLRRFGVGSVMDDNILHTIRLLQHARKTKSLTRSLQGVSRSRGKERKELEDPKNIPNAPPVPEQYIKNEKPPFSYPFLYLEKTFSPFALGEPTILRPLNEESAQRSLRKAIIVLLAHGGYNRTSFATLDVLTDVAQHLIMKLARQLRIAVDHEEMRGSTGFSDIMERVFAESGLGSTTSLHNFYQRSVVQYRHKMLTRCRALEREYVKALPPSKRKERDAVKLMVEEIVVEDDVPEIHFPATGDGYTAEGLQPSLEPGFQMLHSLEQEEQLQNLEPEEEINVSDSPAQESNRQKSSEGPKGKKKKRK